MNHGPAPVQVGEIIAGKYRTERVLGMGAMGVVVEATNIALQQRVALKFLLGQRSSGDGMHERFLREARAAARLKSEHVARVTDVGILESGAPYMVMELLEGCDLGAELETRRQLPVPEAADYLLQACEAIAEAHQAGIVHRDLKPSNLFLTRDANGQGHVKVFDFGVSKVADESAKLTAAGQSVGSPLYMSPEQTRGLPDVDGRADIWALGVILYELITGTTPFYADTLLDLMMNIVSNPPIPIRTYVQDVPPDLELIISLCLEKDRERRCPDVVTLAGMLANFAPPPPPAGSKVTGVVRRSSSSALPVPPSVMAPVSSVGFRSSGAPVLGAAPIMGGVPVMGAAPALGVSTSGAGTTSGTSQSSASGPVTAPQRSRGPLVAILGVTMVAGAVGGWFVLSGSRNTASPAIAPAADTALAAPTSAPVVTATSGSAPSSAPVVETASAAAPVSPSASASVTASPSAVASAAPAAPAGAAAIPAAHPGAKLPAKPAAQRPDLYGGRK